VPAWRCVRAPEASGVPRSPFSSLGQAARDPWEGWLLSVTVPAHRPAPAAASSLPPATLPLPAPAPVPAPTLRHYQKVEVRAGHPAAHPRRRSITAACAEERQPSMYCTWPPASSRCPHPVVVLVTCPHAWPGPVHLTSVSGSTSAAGSALRDPSCPSAGGEIIRDRSHVRDQTWNLES